MSFGLNFVFEVRHNFKLLLLFCFKFVEAIRLNIIARFRWPKVNQDIALCKEIIARYLTKADGRRLQSFRKQPSPTMKGERERSGVREAETQELKTANVDQLFAVCRKRHA